MIYVCKKCGGVDKADSIDKIVERKKLCTKCIEEKEASKAKKETKECKNCGKVFKGYKSQLYCTLDCRTINQNKKYKRTCVQCGKCFTANYAKFCSSKCKILYGKINKTYKVEKQIKKAECTAKTKIYGENESILIGYINEKSRKKI